MNDQGVTITKKQSVKGQNGEQIEQSVEITGLENEEAMILLDKLYTYGEMSADPETRTMRKDAYTYPPGSKYGGGARKEPLADDAPLDAEPAEPSGPVGESNALGDDIDPSKLGDLRDEVAALLNDANFKFERKDGKLAVEITIAGRSFTFDDEDFDKLRDALATATALEDGDGLEGAEEILPTRSGGLRRSVSLGAIATSGNDPATVNKENDANIQSFNTGFLVVDGLDIKTQIDLGLYAGVIVTT